MSTKIVDGVEVEMSAEEETAFAAQQALDAEALVITPPVLTPAEKLAAAGLTVADLKSLLGLK